MRDCCVRTAVFSILRCRVRIFRSKRLLLYHFLGNLPPLQKKKKNKFRLHSEWKIFRPCRKREKWFNYTVSEWENLPMIDMNLRTKMNHEMSQKLGSFNYRTELYRKGFYEITLLFPLGEISDDMIFKDLWFIDFLKNARYSFVYSMTWLFGHSFCLIIMGWEYSPRSYLGK